MNNLTTIFRYDPPRKGHNIAWFRLFSLADQTHIYEWYLMTYDLNIYCKVPKEA